MPLYFSRIESSCGSFMGLKCWYMKKICCFMRSKCGGGGPEAPTEGKPMLWPQCAHGVCGTPPGPVAMPPVMPPGQGHCAPGAGHGIIGGPPGPSFSGLRLPARLRFGWPGCDRERWRLRLRDRELRRLPFFSLLRRPGAPDFPFGARAVLRELRAFPRRLVLGLPLLLLPLLPSALLSRLMLLLGEVFVFRLSVGLTGVSLAGASPASATTGTGDEAVLFRARPLARA